jgi:RNA polymerase sigma-70 factor (ECF subfamily)
MAGGSRHTGSGPLVPDRNEPDEAPPRSAGAVPLQEDATVAASSPNATQPQTALAEPEADALPAPVDAARFAELFASEAPRIWRALRRLGVPEGDVDDVCQEVFLVVYRRWHEFRGESSLRTWVYGIALRKALSYRRGKLARNTVAFGEADGSSVGAPQPSEIARSETRDALCRALERLREGKREVFVLYELEELPMREIAVLLEAPLHTCYARLYAARTELAAILRRAGHDGEGT